MKLIIFGRKRHFWKGALKMSDWFSGKTRVLWYVAPLFILTCVVSFYWFYWAEPDPLPTRQEMAAEMNRLFPEVVVGQIQETLYLDERHLFVPFRSEGGSYGFSVWAWRWHRWQVASIESTGQPKLIKLHNDNPASYHLVWNLHPSDGVSKIAFYLKRERSFRYSDGEEYYDPSIQMKKEVSVGGRSYGWLALPGHWVSVLKSLMTLDAQTHPKTGLDDLMDQMFPPPMVYFGWIPYNHLNQETFPERSVNGQHYSNGKLSVDYILKLDKDEIETPR
jgi:hypothetical protein